MIQVPLFDQPQHSYEKRDERISRNFPCPENGTACARISLVRDIVKPFSSEAPDRLLPNLETGDVIEGLPNAQFPIVLSGATWHPQNEALFSMVRGHNSLVAIQHAYSYPGTKVLTSASVSQTLAHRAIRPNQASGLGPQHFQRRRCRSLDYAP